MVIILNTTIYDLKSKDLSRLKNVLTLLSYNSVLLKASGDIFVVLVRAEKVTGWRVADNQP